MHSEEGTFKDEACDRDFFTTSRTFLRQGMEPADLLLYPSKQNQGHLARPEAPCRVPRVMTLTPLSFDTLSTDNL